MSIVNKMAEDLYEQLSKAEAPIVARVRRKILKDSGLAASKRRKLKGPKVVQKSEFTFDDGSRHEMPLAKNEYQMTSYGSGDVMMEFGPEVPEEFRRRAIEWAKARGLKAKAQSMAKSENSATWIVFRSN